MKIYKIKEKPSLINKKKNMMQKSSLMNKNQFSINFSVLLFVWEISIEIIIFLHFSQKKNFNPIYFGKKVVIRKILGKICLQFKNNSEILNKLKIFHIKSIYNIIHWRKLYNSKFSKQWFMLNVVINIIYIQNTNIFVYVYNVLLNKLLVKASKFRL